MRGRTARRDDPTGTELTAPVLFLLVQAQLGQGSRARLDLAGVLATITGSWRGYHYD